MITFPKYNNPCAQKNEKLYYKSIIPHSTHDSVDEYDLLLTVYKKYIILETLARGAFC